MNNRIFKVLRFIFVLLLCFIIGCLLCFIIGCIIVLHFYSLICYILPIFCISFSLKNIIILGLVIFTWSVFVTCDILHN